MIFPSLAASKYSSWSTSGRRYKKCFETYFSAAAGSMSQLTGIPESASFSKKQLSLRGFLSYTGGLMSFTFSYTAASAGLETMNAGRKVD